MGEDEVDVGICGGFEFFDAGAERPAGGEVEAVAGEEGFEARQGFLKMKVERGEAEEVDAGAGTPRFFIWGKIFCDVVGEVGEGVCDALVVGVHGVRGEGESGDAGVAFEDAAEGGKVGGDEVGDLRGNDADEVRVGSLRGVFDVAQELVVAAKDGVVFGHGGDEDEAVMVVPAWFVVCRVRGVAAGRVVDDNHAAEFEERGADAEGVC